MWSDLGPQALARIIIIAQRVGESALCSPSMALQEGFRRNKPRRCSRLPSDRLPAFEAELGSRRERGIALDAHAYQAGTTLQTKFRPWRIFLLALGTLHTRAPLSSALL